MDIHNYNYKILCTHVIKSTLSQYRKRAVLQTVQYQTQMLLLKLKLFPYLTSGPNQYPFNTFFSWIKNSSKEQHYAVCWIIQILPNAPTNPSILIILILISIIKINMLKAQKSNHKNEVSMLFFQCLFTTRKSQKFAII